MDHLSRPLLPWHDCFSLRTPELGESQSPTARVLGTFYVPDIPNVDESWNNFSEIRSGQISKPAQLQTYRANIL